MLNGHLLGIYEKAFPSEWDWAKKFEAAQSLGFDFFEISIDESDARLARLDWSEQELLDFHRELNRTKLSLQSMCLSAHRRFPFGSCREDVRRRADDIMEKAILFAKEFGIRVIQLAGYDVYYEPSTPESVSCFLDGLHRACAFAGQHQVMLAMEIMDTSLLNSITKYMQYKHALQSPWFSVYPDIGNLSAWGNDVAYELRLGQHEIVAIHLKDTLAVTPDFPGKFKGVPFGQGCVDFSKAFYLLEKQRYTGPFLIEMWHQPGGDALGDIQRAVQFVQGKYQEGLARRERELENARIGTV